MPKLGYAQECYEEHWLKTQQPSPKPEWDYGHWIVEVLKDRFEVIESVFGVEEAAGPLMKLLEQAMMHEEGGEDVSDWREALQTVTHVSWTVMHLPNLIDYLGCYGLYGVVWGDRDWAHRSAEQRAAYIEGMLSEVEAFVVRADLERIAGKTNPITRILNLAQARWNIDRKQGDVDPASLAILGGLSEGRIRNMMSGQDRVFENVGGRVTAASALAWLQTREEFRPSVWDQDEEDEENVTSETATKRLADVEFVPMAQDRSIFHPGLARNGRYQIGPKGEEVSFDSFEDALEALQHMPEAYWRRPNAAGNWGIVKATEWVRVEWTALQRGMVTA